MTLRAIILLGTLGILTGGCGDADGQLDSADATGEVHGALAHQGPAPEYMTDRPVLSPVGPVLSPVDGAEPTDVFIPTPQRTARQPSLSAAEVNAILAALERPVFTAFEPMREIAGQVCGQVSDEGMCTGSLLETCLDGIPVGRDCAEEELTFGCRRAGGRRRAHASRGR